LLDAAAERVLERSGELAVPEYELSADSVDGAEMVVAKLELRAAATKRWTAAGPLAQVQLSGEFELAWDGRAPLHRLVVADTLNASTILDVVVLGSSARVPSTGINVANNIRYSVQAWLDGTWITIQHGRPLPLPVILGSPREPPPPLVPEAPQLLVLFTIDTECTLHRQRHPNPERTVEELVFGNFGGGERLGIELLMDLLEHFGQRGSFFVDVLMEYQFGQAALERTLEAILTRGHEVELHVHPENLEVAADPSLRELGGSLARCDPDRFRRVMELSVDLFTRRVGRPPLAYRAGGYHIDQAMLEALADFGIAIDSSAHAYFHSRIPDWMRTRTQPFRVGDVLELPPSWFLRLDTEPPTTRVYAPNPTAGDPFVGFAQALPQQAPLLAVYVAHSFGQMRYSDESEEFARDWCREMREHLPEELAERLIPPEEHRFSVAEPERDDVVIATVASLLRRIADAPGARTVTFAELHDADRWFSGPRREAVDFVPAFDPRTGEETVRTTRIYSDGLLAVSAPGGEVPAPVPAVLCSLLQELPLRWRGAELAIVGDWPQERWLQAQLPFTIERVDHVEDLEPGRRDIVVWSQDCAARSPGQVIEHLSRLGRALRPGGHLLLHARTLGVSGDPRLPPLAELLFAQRDLAAVRTDPAADVAAWDAASFREVLAASGFEPRFERRHPHDRLGLAALDEHAVKFRALDPEELRTAAVTLVGTRRWQLAGPDVARPASGRGALPVLNRSDPIRLAATVAQIYERTTPGGEIELACSQEQPALLSATTVAVALQRAGFELLGDSLVPAIRCTRPLEVDEIFSYSGYARPEE
jgi:hypothetical protein